MQFAISAKNVISAALVVQGNHHMFQGRYLVVIDLFDKALENCPESFGAFQGCAFCKTQVLASIPLEEHLIFIQSIVEDLETVTTAYLININWFRIFF